MTSKPSNADRAKEYFRDVLGKRQPGLWEGETAELTALLDSVAAEAEMRGRREGIEEAAKLCDKRAWEMKSSASGLVEHYGPEADGEASMYDADGIGATALAKAIRALLPAKEEAK